MIPTPNVSVGAADEQQARELLLTNADVADIAAALHAARLDGARQALAWTAKKCEFLAEVLPDKAVGAITQLGHVREMCQRADPAAIVKEQP